MQEMGRVHGAAQILPDPPQCQGRILPQSSPCGELKAVLSTQCLCSLCPDKKIKTHGPNARQLLPAQVVGWQQGRGTLTLLTQLLLHSARAKLTALCTSGSSTAAGDTRSFCREREILPEPAGQEAPCPRVPPGSDPAHTPQQEQQITA